MLIQAVSVELEGEDAAVFREVTMRHTHPMRVPVTLAIAPSHLRITTVSHFWSSICFVMLIALLQMKAQTIGNALSCKATEIIPLADVNDVYNISTGHDSHEFIIRKVRHGVTLYFSSPDRDTIVKVCLILIMLELRENLVS